MASFLRGSGSQQTTYVSGPTGVTSPVQVTFDAVQNSSGSEITLNTSTGTFTLAANKNYRLIASVNATNCSNGVNGNVQYQWYNSTNSAYFGSIGYVMPNTFGSTGLAEAIFSTTTTTNVYLQARPTSGTSTFAGIYSINLKWVDIQLIEDAGSPSGNITVSNASVTGNVTAGAVVTNQLTGAVILNGSISTAGTLTGANVVGGNILTSGTLSATSTTISSAGVTITGNLAVNGYGSVTAKNISVTGNISGTLQSSNIVGSGSISANTITSNGNVSAVSNISGGNVITSGIVSAIGIITSNNTITGQNFSTPGKIIASGNIQGNYFIGNGRLLTGISTSGGYGNANVAAYLPTYTGAITTTSTIGAGNFSTSGQVVATGNISGGNLRTVGSVSATGTFTGGNITGTNISAIGNVTAGKIVTSGGVFWANGTAYSESSTVTSGPAFIATQTRQQPIAISPTNISLLPLIYNSVSKNIGNGYNSTTGVFTAPVAGFYQVSASVVAGPLTIPVPSTFYGGGALILYRGTTGIVSGPFIEARSLIIGPSISTIIESSNVSTLVYLIAGETLQCVLGYVTNASNLIAYGNLIPSYFSACWIRGA